MEKITNSRRPLLRHRSKDLEGKVAVITGGTRGIGRATALHLVSRGCKVLVTATSQSSLDEHVHSMQETVIPLFANVIREDFTGVVADIYSPDCANIIADAVGAEYNGRIDILILNAAAPYITEVGNLIPDDVSKSLLGNVQTNALIVDELVKRKYFQLNSRIIFISSVRGRMPWKRQLMYSAGKAAGEMMCKTWAECFGGKHDEFSFMAGTTANAIVTGLTATDAVLNMPSDILDEVKEEFLPHQDIPKFAVAEDVADAVGMLCGNDARWITGQSVSVSGGLVKLQ